MQRLENERMWHERLRAHRGQTAVAAVLSRILGQRRRASVTLGRLAAKGMNLGHSRLADWDPAQVPVGEAFDILDVGRGGGRTVR